MNTDKSKGGAGDASQRPSLSEALNLNISAASKGVSGLEQLESLVASLEQLRDSAEVIKAFQREMAALTWNRYEALLNQGFNEQQALYYITHRPEMM